MHRAILVAITFCLLPACGGARKQASVVPPARAASATTGEASLCDAGDVAYSIAAPEGWLIDVRAGKPNGLCAVLYPTGGSWRSSPAVMYPNVLSKGPEGFAGAVTRELDEFRRKSPDIIVEDSKATLNDGFAGPVVVKRIRGKGSNSYEECAYVDGKNAILVVVLTSRDQAEFERALPAFSKLVDSVLWIDRSRLLEEMIRLGQQDEAQPASKEYWPAAIAKIVPTLGGAMRSCTSRDQPPPPGFDLVFLPASDGIVDAVIATEGSQLAECVGKKVVGARVPPPPFMPYHIHIAMKVGP